LAIWQRVAWFWAVFALHMRRNGYLWAPKENFDMIIRADFLMGTIFRRLKSVVS